MGYSGKCEACKVYLATDMMVQSTFAIRHDGQYGLGHCVTWHLCEDCNNALLKMQLIILKGLQGASNQGQ